MKLARLERLAGACGVALGVGALVVARSFPRTPGAGWMDDPRLWPTLLALALAGLSAMLLVRPDRRERTVAFTGAGWGLALLATGAVYLWLLWWAGYFTASVAWVAAVMLIAGERQWVSVVATSLALTAAGYLLFWKVMVIALPPGLVDEWLGLTHLYR